MNLHQNPHALTVLRANGWFPGRSVAITRAVAALRREGFQPNERAEALLRALNGLHLWFPDPRSANSKQDLHIDAEQAAESVYAERVEEYARQLGEPLCVVGEAYQRHMTVAISPSGKVVLGYDELLLLAGDSPEGALENIVLGREMPEIPELSEDEEEP